METKSEIELGDESENYLTNDNSDEVLIDVDWYKILWITVNVLLMVFIVGGNVLTIFAVRMCRRLRSVVSNLFILSLAVSDIIVGLTLPYHLALYLTTGLDQSFTLCLLRFYILIFACCISIWNLIAIAVDRYIAIMYPLHYRRLMTRRAAMIIIAVGWIVGASLACIPVFWNDWHTAVECEFNQVLPSWYMAGIITPGFVIIWVCMLLVYWRICQEASKQAKQLRKATCCPLKDAPSDWKSVQVVLLIMGAFTICWLPYFTVACGQIFVSFEITLSLYKGVLALAMANSGLNPLIYAWKNSNFRQSFGLLLRCKSPNSVITCDYIVREHFPRRISLIETHETGSLSCNPSLPIGAPITEIQEPSSAIDSSDPLSINDSISKPIATAKSNTTVLEEVRDVKPYHTEVSRNPLPMLAKIVNDSYMAQNLSYLCSPCEFSKLIFQKHPKQDDNSERTLVLLKYGQNFNHMESELNCRW